MLVLGCFPLLSITQAHDAVQEADRPRYEFVRDWNVHPCKPSQWITRVGVLESSIEGVPAEFYILIQQPPSIVIASLSTGFTVRTIELPLKSELTGLLECVGDFDKDGVGDLALGLAGTGQRWIEIISGIDGKKLQQFQREVDCRALGYSVCELPGRAGTGTLVVGSPSDVGIPGSAPSKYCQKGIVLLINSSSGQKPRVLEGDMNGDGFGWFVGNIGDIDSDGCADFAVGAPWFPLGTESSGYLRAYSGRTARQIFTLTPESSDSQLRGHDFGCWAAPCEDINSDKIADIIVCAPGAHFISLRKDHQQTSGVARIFSGKDGKLLTEINSPGGFMESPFFGEQAFSIGDIDGDEFPELVISSPQEKHAGYENGALRCYSTGPTTMRCSVIAEGPGSDLGRCLCVFKIQGTSAHSILASSGNEVVRFHVGVNGAKK